MQQHMSGCVDATDALAIGDAAAASDLEAKVRDWVIRPARAAVLVVARRSALVVAIVIFILMLSLLLLVLLDLLLLLLLVLLVGDLIATCSNYDA